jgi:hypothetical protein
MSATCNDFRQRLRVALEGGLRGEASLEAVRPLAWHEHLFTCTECRDLLEAEEALEDLLASLPSPVLPKLMARRILRRLSSERHQIDVQAKAPDLDHVLTSGDSVDVPVDLAVRVLEGISSEREANALDALLDRVPTPQIPNGLVERVRNAAHIEREAALDSLLELVPAPEIPAQLADRILAALDSERTTRPRTLRPQFGALRYVAAIAATLVVSLGAWRMIADPGTAFTSPDERENVASAGDDRAGLPDVPDVLYVPDAIEAPTGAGTELADAVNTGDGATLDPDTELTINAGSTAGELGVAPELLDPIALPEAAVLASLDILEDWELLMSEDLDVLLGSLDDADAELLFLLSGDSGLTDTTDTEEG